MAVLSRKQQFAEKYIEFGGNGLQAAIAVGYKPTAASVAASRLLRDQDVIDYLAMREKQVKDDQIATSNEVLVTLTKVLRRQLVDHRITMVKEKRLTYDTLGHEIKIDTTTPQIVELPTAVADVVKAADLLGKFYALWERKTDEADVEDLSPLVEMLTDVKEADD